MDQETNAALPLTGRQDEERRLSDTLAVVRANIASYGEQVRQMQADIDEMLEHYHDNDMESLTELNNTVTLHGLMKRSLERNLRALSKPYFGRIIFDDETTKRRESLYIGKGSITKDTIQPVVIDWRAPIANAYYENGLGNCSYQAPGGESMSIDLLLKRTYEIENGALLDYFDSEVIANDDLLTKYLAKNKQAVLGEIVATIQKEQNEIIRLTPYRNLIVQGVAGSGKTTVAMHRISYILYNYAEHFRPEDFYIVGSNQILLNYITGVLPELDVHGVRQMTMEQLFTRLLYEEWDERKHRLRTPARHGHALSVQAPGGDPRSRRAWFEDLKSFCDELEQRQIRREDVFLDPEFVARRAGRSRTDRSAAAQEEIPDLIADRGAVLKDRSAVPQEEVLLFSRETIENYLRQTPALSLQSKIDGLNERLMNRIQNYFLEHIGRYTEDERREITRAYRGWFGGKKSKLSIRALYRDFLLHQQSRGCAADIPQETSDGFTEYDLYDLAALAYLYARVPETEVIREARHIVIDEAQDFGMMAYCVLDFCIRGCTYTIMGDVSQNIHFGSGLNDWEDLRALLLRDRTDSFRVLKKSYRNTMEISEYALRILRHGTFSVYPVEPIIRHGNPVETAASAPEELYRQAARILLSWQSQGYGALAVVCRDPDAAVRASAELANYVTVRNADPDEAVFGEGILVLPVEYTKGLEFDAVLILDPTRADYPTDDGHAKLLYVAATRALHELCVLHTGDLTGLIADEPASPARLYTEDGGEKTAAFQKSTGQKATNLFFSSGKSLEMPDRYDADRILQAARQKNGPARDAQTPGPARAAAPVKATGFQNGSRQTDSAPEHGKRSSAARPSALSGQAASLRGTEWSRLVSSVPKNAAAPKQTPAPDAKGTDTRAADRAAAGPAAAQGPTAQRSVPAQAKTPKPARPAARPAFGSAPPEDTLRPPGHSRIDLAVRWTSRQPDGLCLQSRYGVLRLSPVTSRILRVTFAKLGQLSAEPHSRIAVRQTDRFWMYREMGGCVELLTDELCLRIDKPSGAVQYMTRDRQPLLAEQTKLCRQMEPVNDISCAFWLYLNWAKNERLRALDPAGGRDAQLRARACMISPDDAAAPFPLLVSDRGYGLLIASSGPVVCCDLPAFGSYIQIRRSAQLDFYFILGGTEEAIRRDYDFLCGRK